MPFACLDNPTLCGGFAMIFASTGDIVAQLADDMDVNLCVAATIVDSLICDDTDN